MRAIAQGREYTVPATIEVASVLEQVVRHLRPDT
jgi:hypothetical protein